MAASKKDSSLNTEPAVKDKGANRQLVRRNSRASNNWFRARSALDREKREFESKINVERSVLLKQRERLQSTRSLPLNTMTGPETKTSDGLAEKQERLGQRRLTLAEVCESFMKAVKEQKSSTDNETSQSEAPVLAALMGSTTSFDNKKVACKPSIFSLQRLQHANSNLPTKLQSIIQEEQTNSDVEEEASVEKPPILGPFELTKEEKSFGPTLRLPPNILPPLRNQVQFTPRTRDFENQRAKGTDSPDNNCLEDIKYCRYVRIGNPRPGRRNTKRAVRPQITKPRANHR